MNTEEMNLLILGAGGHGRVVRETAEAMRVYDTIVFLDDHNPAAVGKLDVYKAFRDRFDSAFVALGDNKLRSEWLEKLKLAGYQIPALIHPRAYVSPSSTVGHGSIIEPLACINTGTVIEEGCIISVSAVIDHDSKIDSFSHIDCGVVLPPRTYVDSYRKLESINLYQTDNSDRELDNGETPKESVLSENSGVKILIESAVVIFACLLVFEILPRTATFFTLASSHTTFAQKLIHSALVLVLILLSRTSLMVYRQPWNRTKAMSYIHIIVADAMAGVVFYIVAEFVLNSVYPFLLELSLFMLIDVGTLFYRLLNRGISEEYGTTEQ